MRRHFLNRVRFEVVQNLLEDCLQLVEGRSCLELLHELLQLRDVTLVTRLQDHAVDAWSERVVDAEDEEEGLRVLLLHHTSEVGAVGDAALADVVAGDDELTSTGFNPVKDRASEVSDQVILVVHEARGMESFHCSLVSVVRRLENERIHDTLLFPLFVDELCFRRFRLISQDTHLGSRGREQTNVLSLCEPKARGYFSSPVLCSIQPRREVVE